MLCHLDVEIYYSREVQVQMYEDSYLKFATLACQSIAL